MKINNSAIVKISFILFVVGCISLMIGCSQNESDSEEQEINSTDPIVNNADTEGVSLERRGDDGDDDDDDNNNKTVVKLMTFQMPEVVPNTELENPEEVRRSRAVLKRKNNKLKAKIKTRDLPPGAYSFWWHLTHDDGEVSILWAANAIVGNNGKAKVRAVLPEGEENAPGFIFIGSGLQPGGAATAEVELWIRLHGAPNEDPDLLYLQLNMPFGLCTDVRNPMPLPDIDYPCWNPQRAVFGDGN